MSAVEELLENIRELDNEEANLNDALKSVQAERREVVQRLLRAA